jgi:GPH family glycoside/pentoside/hexuronide:cation symporter/probable glucitol transport protein GutA
MNEQKIGSGKVSTKEIIFLPLGVMSQAMLFSLVIMYAMYYFTDVAGFYPIAVGTFFLLERIWDAINDAMMGVIADRTRTRWGKFKPYIMFAPIFVSVFTFLLFALPDMPMQSKFIFAGIMYILVDMSYTAVDIPLWASPALVTSDSKTVTSLISRNQFAAYIGGLIAGVFTIILVQAFGGEEGGGFGNAALIFGVIAFVLTTIAGITVKERVKPKDEKKLKIKEIYTVVIKNKYLLIAFLTSALIGISGGIKGLVGAYFVEYNLGDINLLPMFMIVVMIPTLLGILITSPVVKKFGKKSASIASIAIALVISVLAYFIGYGNLYIVMAVHALIGFFTAIPMVISTTIFADAVTYGEWKSGKRVEGTIFSFRTLSGKISNAVGPFIFGLVLVGSGYVANTQQSMEALDGLQFTITIVPAIMIALCIIPLIFYKLTDKKMDELQQEINNKNQEEQM